MNKELNIFTLRMLRDQYHTEHLDTEAEVLDAAIEKFEWPEIIRCKDCKYFELDHWEYVHGVNLIVAHEICMRWGDGVKTDQNGYCFLAERRTDDEK